MARPRLSKAQRKFMDLWVPAQKYWRDRGGWDIGSVAATKLERISLIALVRKGFAAADGQFTDAGLAAYERKKGRPAA
ncbi:UNVERIFIED_ORG: hypothetical protein M2193_000057 [Bradyrhizobium japonicum]